MKIEMSKAEQEEARLTAYALGELEADEAKVLEAQLKESPELRASLKEIESTAALLSAEFLNEPSLSLRDDQVEAITSEDKADNVTKGSFMPLMAVAACACLFTAVGMKQYLAGLESRDQKFSAKEDEALSAPAVDGASAASEPKTAMLKEAKAEGTDSESAASLGAPTDDVRAEGLLASRSRESEAGAKADFQSDSMMSAPGALAGVEPDDSPVRRTVTKKKSVAPQSLAKPAPKSPVPTESRPMMRAVEADAIDPGQARRKVQQEAPVVAAAPKKVPTRGLKKGFDVSKRLDEKKLVGRVTKSADGESYGHLVDNPWVSTWDDGLSTFAIDVDTGTYPNVRRFLTRRAALPPKDAVRIEEMINYFSYDYPEPEGKVPFSVNMEVASCPWAKDHRLLRVGLRGKGVAVDKRPPSNLVFLVDVSGSMRGAEKLDLLKRSMKSMVGELNEDDRIGIVTYSGSSGVALEPTHGDQKEKITTAFDRLKAGGGTNGASGITTAYSLAKSNFVEGGTNRVILATDGDFNVGVTNNGDLIQMVEKRAREDKVFLTVLGVGQGNLKEDRMEQIADKGNGSYHYLDTEKEGQKVLVRGLGATLVTVAKDVKVQLDFNPAEVAKYRLLGYANRKIPDEAFHDPKADAGEIGAGHTVTAFYEIVPADPDAEIPEGPKAGSRFRKKGALVESEMTLQLALNYKLPDSDDPEPTIEVPLVDPGKDWPEASEDFRFGAAVAGFGMLLRGSDYAGLLNYDLVLELGGEGIAGNGDKFGMRAEFMDLVKSAKRLSPTKE